LLIGVGVLSTSFCLYGAMAADEKSDFANEVSFEADSLRQFIQNGLDNRIQPLIRMARLRAAAPNLSQQDWDADAQAILTRGGYQAIEWINASGRAIWTTPPGAGDATPDGNAAFEPRRRAAFDMARERRELAATKPIDLVTGGKGMIVAVPVFVRGELAGYVAGVFRYQLLFQNLLASNPSSRYGISIRSNGETVFEQGAATRLPGLKRSVELAVGSSRWNLEIAPTEALVVQARSPVAGALLVAGAFLAILLAMLAYLIQKGGARAGVDAAPTGLPAPLARFARKAALPVVSYRRDGALLASAALLGPWMGAVAGGLGSALSDLYLGYPVYAAATLIIKGLMGWLAGWISFRTEGAAGWGRRIGASAAAIGVLVIGLVDNLLRPLLSRHGSVQLPTLVLLVAMFGGLATVGAWGLLLGPLLVRLAVEAVAIERDERLARAAPVGPRVLPSA
jgi:sensor domain CHASE-containing protein/uncharacterized membrane protein